jgi:hypothetical protein
MTDAEAGALIRNAKHLVDGGFEVRYGEYRLCREPRRGRPVYQVFRNEDPVPVFEDVSSWVASDYLILMIRDSCNPSSRS